MYLEILSDLHIDSYDNFNLEHYLSSNPNPETILVIAGDIANNLAKDTPVISKFFLDLRRIVKDRYDCCLIVLGNHDYYGYGFQEPSLEQVVSKKVGQSYISSVDGFSPCRIIRKDFKEIFIINYKEYYRYIFYDYGLSIFGGTMWTNFNNDPLLEFYATRVINDFRCIPGLTIDFVKSEFESFNYFSKKYTDRLGSLHYKNIIISHFAPFQESIHPRYKGSPINGYFCNNVDLSLFAKKPDIWIHGHVHDHFDYIKDDVRVVANPLG